MNTLISDKPAIYYVVQGRSTNNDGIFIEQTFVNSNPIEARERAFSYLEYYVQLLHQGKKILFSNKNLISKDITLDTLNNYSVTFAENNFGIDGIAIYMVIDKPIEYMNIFDKKNDRYLIYSVQNLTDSKISEIKNSLIREYGYYSFSKINTRYKEDFIEFNIKSSNSFFKSEALYTILKTPFDFYFTSFKKDISNLFCLKVTNDFKVINLKKTTFISKLDWHAIRVHLSSFLNTEGGCIYLGKYMDNKIINCFKTNSIKESNDLLHKNLIPFFPKHKKLFTFRYVKINKVLVPIIVVEPAYSNYNLYDITTSNNFYYRNNKGIQKINEIQKIIEYVLENKHSKPIDMNEFLDML